MEERHLPQDTVDFDFDAKELVLVDQTLLPGVWKRCRLKELPEIWRAIHILQVRGAPAIGVAAAFGLYLAAEQSRAKDYETFCKELKKAKEYLASARPTAVNLFWALERMERVVLAHPEQSVAELKRRMGLEAARIREEDIDVCRRIGEHGLALLSPGMGILTHCNAGQLAAVRYGTALAPIYVGEAQGYHLRVFADETRPLLQGARLTAYELCAAGIDTTLICDNMASAVMQAGLVQAVLTGCDRVAANGDAANKIGTSGVAILAKHYGIPFYLCAPTSTIDMACPTGAQIPVEQREPSEVTELWYQSRMAPPEVKVFNPAFDVTDASLISGVVTELGVVRPPYTEHLKELMNRNGGTDCTTEDC